MSALMADDVCRACFHDDHRGATCSAVDPVDINPHGHRCLCNDYVDAEAEGNIVVRVEDDSMNDEAWAETLWRVRAEQGGA